MNGYKYLRIQMNQFVPILNALSSCVTENPVLFLYLGRNQRFLVLLFLGLLGVPRPAFSLAQWTNRGVTMDLLMT